MMGHKDGGKLAMDRYIHATERDATAKVAAAFGMHTSRYGGAVPLSAAASKPSPRQSGGENGNPRHSIAVVTSTGDNETLRGVGKTDEPSAQAMTRAHGGVQPQAGDRLPGRDPYRLSPLGFRSPA